MNRRNFNASLVLSLSAAMLISHSVSAAEGDCARALQYAPVMPECGAVVGP